MDSRVEREKRFHDSRFADQRRSHLGVLYRSLHGSSREFQSAVFACGPGIRALEYGCGTGGLSFELARRGYDVTGIDISEVAIRQACEKAVKEGIEDRMRFHVMNGEELEFPDNSFDLVFGTGILHHLDLDRSLTEIVRVLRPQGRAVFREPLAHHPIVNLYRRLTPSLRSIDEHPLTVRDLERISAIFHSADLSFHHLLSPVAALFASTPFSKPIRAFLETADTLLLRLPFLRRYAWQVVLVLKNPGS